jgi:hypothetical protein
MQLIWNGTDEERGELLDALARHCACVYDTCGARTHTCSPHTAFITSQRFLDGLVFVRRIASQILAEEWMVDDWRASPTALPTTVTRRARPHTPVDSVVALPSAARREAA